MAKPRRRGDGARATGARGLSRAEFVGLAGVCALAGAWSATAYAAGGLTASDTAGTAQGSSASAEVNKVLRFADIPEEALISVGQLHALIEGELTVDDILAGKPAPGEQEAADAGAPAKTDAATTPARTSKVPVPATTLPEKASTTKFADFMLLDIRSHRDYSKRLINGSRNIPAGRQLEIRIDEVPDDKLVVLISNKNTDRLAETRQTLIDAGRDPDLLKVVDGGVSAWVEEGYPTLENQFLGC